MAAASACVVGVDGCPGGWIAALCAPSIPLLRFSFHAAFRELLARHRGAACIAVDIPIGLMEDGAPRACDVAARRALGRARSASVFPAPDRRLLEAASYKNALALSRHLCGRGIARQAFNIYAKVADVDCAMTAALERRVVEAHPELSFWAMAGRRPMAHSKKSAPGFDERRQALLTALPGLPIPNRAEARRLAPSAEPDDVLDAIAAAWTALRVVAGTASRFPPAPPRDARGLRMEIVY